MRQNGPSNVFVSLGQMHTGAVALDSENPIGENAGRAKIEDKRVNGYTKDIELKSLIFDDLPALQEWIAKNFKKSARSTCLQVIQKFAWAADEGVHFPEAPKRAKPEPDDEPLAARHPDWGSW